MARQRLRHWTRRPQEICVSGDTRVTMVMPSGVSKKVKISDLYRRYTSRQYWGVASNTVRVFDEESGRLTSAPIKEVCKAGRKPVVRMALEGGKKIVATKEHKVLTRDGFKEIGSLCLETDFVATNGVPQARLFSSKEVCVYRRIKSIECAGEAETYDLEIDHKSNNYVANGIVTHNSQRYADVTQLGKLVYYDARKQHTTNHTRV